MDIIGKISIEKMHLDRKEIIHYIKWYKSCKIIHYRFILRKQ